MKMALVAMLIALLLQTTAGAAPSTALLGISQSDEKALTFHSAPGIMLGIAREWHLAARMVLSGELDLHYKRIALREQRVWHYPGMLSLYDLNVKTLFLEVPVLAGFTIPVHSSRLLLYAGPSLNLCLSGAVERIKLGVIDDEPKGDGGVHVTDHDISFIEDPGPAVALNNSSVGLILGLWMSWAHGVFGLCYSFSRLHELDAVKMDKPYHSFSLLLSF